MNRFLLSFLFAFALAVLPALPPAALAQTDGNENGNGNGNGGDTPQRDISEVERDLKREVEERIITLERQVYDQNELNLRRIEYGEERVDSFERSLDRILLMFGLSLLLGFFLLGNVLSYKQRLALQRLSHATYDAENIMRDIKREITRPELEHLRISQVLRRLMRQLREKADSSFTPEAITELRGAANDPYLPASLHFIARVLTAEQDGNWNVALQMLDQLREMDSKDPDVLLHLSHVHSNIAARTVDARQKRSHQRWAYEFYGQFAALVKMDGMDTSEVPTLKSIKAIGDVSGETITLEDAKKPAANVIEAKPIPTTATRTAAPVTAAAATATAAKAKTPKEAREAREARKAARDKRPLAIPQSKPPVVAPAPKPSKPLPRPKPTPMPAASASPTSSPIPPPVKSTPTSPPPKPPPAPAASSPPPAANSAAPAASPSTSSPPPPSPSSAPAPEAAAAKPAPVTPSTPPASAASSTPTPATDSPKPPPPEAASPAAAATTKPAAPATESPKQTPPPIAAPIAAAAVTQATPAAAADSPQAKKESAEKILAANASNASKKRTFQDKISSLRNTQKEKIVSAGKNIAAAMGEMGNPIESIRSLRNLVQPQSEGELPFLPIPPLSEVPETGEQKVVNMWKETRKGDLQMAKAMTAKTLRERNRMIDQAMIFYAQAQMYKTDQVLYHNWGLALLAKALHVEAKKRAPFFNAAIDKFLAGNVISPHYFDFHLASLYAILGDKDKCYHWLKESRESGKLDVETLQHAVDFDSVRHEPWFDEFLTT